MNDLELKVMELIEDHHQNGPLTNYDRRKELMLVILNECRYRIDRLKAKEIEVLRKGYTECIEDMADWAAYAGDYFREKHDIYSDMKRHQANLKEPDDGK